MLLKDNIKRLFYCNLIRLMTLLKLRRVNKRLQGRLSTMKTTVSQLKSASAKTCILLPKVMVCLSHFRPRNNALSFTTTRLPNITTINVHLSRNFIYFHSFFLYINFFFTTKQSHFCFVLCNN